jgi:hypothetical protein
MFTGRLAQMARAPALQAGSHWFKSSIAQKSASFRRFFLFLDLETQNRFTLYFCLLPKNYSLFKLAGKIFQ